MMQPPNIPRGTPVDTGLFERLVSGLFQRIVAGPGISVSRAGQGIQIAASQGGGGSDIGPPISQFYVYSVDTYWALGYLYNPVAESTYGALIAAALPQGQAVVADTYVLVARSITGLTYDSAPVLLQIIGDGGSAVATVESLPAIPSSGMVEVFWTSVGAGDGDDQVWRAYAGQSAWTPTQYLTNLSGTP